jgi:hypothetical protein
VGQVEAFDCAMLDLLMYRFEIVKSASLCLRFVRSTLTFVSATFVVCC